LTRSDLIAELAASNPHLRGADVEQIVATVFEAIGAVILILTVALWAYLLLRP
jgi:integration host factor subunit beta